MHRIESNAATHRGRRAENQDAHLADPHLGLFAVADGMGGRAGGEVASRLAIGAILALFSQVGDERRTTRPLNLEAQLSLEEGLVDAAVRQANRSICSRRIGALSAMGSTIAVLLLRQDRAIIGHVGDSRVYRLRQGCLTQLTRDHSLYDELLAGGATTLPPRDKFAYSNIITRVLGAPDKAVPDLRTELLREHDVFLLCSDGLSERLSSDRIMSGLTDYPCGEAGPRLVHEAYARGACDNITAVVVAVGERESHSNALEPAAPRDTAAGYGQPAA